MTEQQKHTAAVVGMFDGVHMGHRYLLRNLRQLAEERGLEPLVFTFPRHPMSLICPEFAPKLLSEPAEKLHLLGGSGFSVKQVNFLVFNDLLRHQTAAEFMRMLRRDYGVRLLLRGYNNRFGTERDLTPEDYRRIAAAEGIELIDDRVSFVEADGRQLDVSSSAIRKLLLAGDVAGAARLLGRPYSLSGTVVDGRKLGRQLGFPTANLSPLHKSKLIPAPGVYICNVWEPLSTERGDAAATERGDAAPGCRYPAMLNIGHRPTVDRADSPVSIEAHLLGFEGDIYGMTLNVEFLGRLREEKKFGSVEDLTLQLAEDRKKVEKFFGLD